MKRCSLCKLVKPLTDYCRGNAFDGYDYRCRECKKLYAKSRRKKVPLVKEREFQYRLTHRHERVLSTLKWRAKRRVNEKQTLQKDN